DEPFTEELCPGLVECGRCAAICPEDAIPTSAPADAPLSQYRGLDAAACARSSQSYGPERMVEHLKRIFEAGSGQEAVAVVHEKTTWKIWYNLTLLRQGAFTACVRCELVCPIGADYPVIERSQA